MGDRGPTRKFAMAGLALLAVVTAAAPRVVDAAALLDTPILGGHMLVAEEGHVYISYLGSDSEAGYLHNLYLGSSDQSIFERRARVGRLLDLGPFAAGTELVFRLEVEETGQSYYTGPAERNPDDLAHVLAISTLIDDIFVTDVGYEDTLGGGNEDYDDFRFRLYNVIDPPPAPGASNVPLPSALFLFLAGMGAWRMRLGRRRH